MPPGASNGKVVVVGSANMDLVFRCDRLPAPGETRLARQFETSPGGKGANQAAAIARLGGSVDFVGKVGDDSFGRALLSSLKSVGVRTDHTLTAPDAPTGVAAVIVSADGQNSIVVAPGANQMVTAEEVKQAIGICAPTVVLAQLEIPLSAVQACVGSAMFVLNPAPAASLSDEFLSGVYVLTPNETETETLTAINPTDGQACCRATALLHDRGVGVVVLTLGSRGCFVSDSKKTEHFDPPAVDPVDTTAAGDAFSGALAHFLANGRDIWNAAQLANCVGAVSTTVKGAQASMPSIDLLRSIARDLL
jgi:ribokinase